MFGHDFNSTVKLFQTLFLHFCFNSPLLKRRLKSGQRREACLRWRRSRPDPRRPNTTISAAHQRRTRGNQNLPRESPNAFKKRRTSPKHSSLPYPTVPGLSLASTQRNPAQTQTSGKMSCCWRTASTRGFTTWPSGTQRLTSLPTCLWTRFRDCCFPERFLLGSTRHGTLSRGTSRKSSTKVSLREGAPLPGQRWSCTWLRSWSWDTTSLPHVQAIKLSIKSFNIMEEKLWGFARGCRCC